MKTKTKLGFNDANKAVVSLNQSPENSFFIIFEAKKIFKIFKTSLFLGWNNNKVFSSRNSIKERSKCIAFCTINDRSCLWEKKKWSKKTHKVIHSAHLNNRFLMSYEYNKVMNEFFIFFKGANWMKWKKMKV